MGTTRTATARTTQPATPRARRALRRRLAGAHPTAELKRRLALRRAVSR